MAKEIKLTQESLDAYKEELEYLKTTRADEVAEQLKEARSFGDLSENAEYDEAKNEQGLVESRIAEIEATLKHAVIVDDSDISTEKVGIGNVVTILDMEMEEEMTFQIVGTSEANIDKGHMSNESPIGKALLDHSIGEVVTAETPSGELQFKILNISKKEEA